jgi:membrane protease YdiL (CAAX protease family)
MVIMAAALVIIEEFIFRGMLLNPLRRSAGPVFAVVGSAAIYAILHTPTEAVPAFALGLAAAWIMHRHGRLMWAVLTHWVYWFTIFLFSHSAAVGHVHETFR